MAVAPVTRPTLLLRLRDPKNAADWSQFVAIYAPLIFGFLRKKAVQDADAADLTQDVLQAVAQAMPRLDYDPQRGSFRGWLFTVVRNKLRDFQRRAVPVTGDTEAMIFLNERAAPEPDEEARWQQEYRQRLFTWAAESGVRLVALNRPRAMTRASVSLRLAQSGLDLHERDRWAAGILTDLFSSIPRSGTGRLRVLVLYGELHLAR